MNIFYVFKKLNFYVVREGVGTSINGLGTLSKCTIFNQRGQLFGYRGVVNIYLFRITKIFKKLSAL